MSNLLAAIALGVFLSRPLYICGRSGAGPFAIIASRRRNGSRNPCGPAWSNTAEVAANPSANAVDKHSEFGVAVRIQGSDFCGGLVMQGKWRYHACVDAAVTQMRKGLLEYCVMALLVSAPRYGYEVVNELAKVDGMLTSEGTIYPLLARLRRDRLVATEWRESAGGHPRKYYRLTAEGDQALASFRRQWATVRSAVDEILKGGKK